MTDVLKIPDAWVYELAHSMRRVDDKPEYTNFRLQLASFPPNVPQGSVRNLRPLYTMPPTSEALLAEIEQLRAERDTLIAAMERAHEILERNLGHQTEKCYDALHVLRNSLEQNK